MDTSDPPRHSVITVPVEQPSPAEGTLRWLAAHDLRIRLRTGDRGGREAWLLGEQDTRLLLLCRVGTAGRRVLTREEATDESMVAWTDAAWALIARLAEHAAPLLDEPAWMADALAVRFEPRVPEANALLAEGSVDPSVRGVLRDRLADEGLGADQVPF